MTKVIGSHGTSYAAASAIAQGGFVASRNSYDWLGDGIYFFQDGATRAKQWALDHHRDAAWAVVDAESDLGGCMDFLDPEWVRLLPEAHDFVVEHSRRAGLPLPVQQGGLHGMDREVINYMVGYLAQQGQPIRSVRGAF